MDGGMIAWGFGFAAGALLTCAALLVLAKVVVFALRVTMGKDDDRG